MRQSVILLAILLGACKSATPAIERSTVTCAKSSDCPALLPTCDPVTKICMGCITGMNTCANGFECDDRVHTCVAKQPDQPECVRDSDCPPVGEVSQRSICRLASHTCVECQIDDDCSGAVKRDGKALDLGVPVCDNGLNPGVPDLGRVPTFRCISGCSLCQPPLGVCDVLGKTCLPGN